jgi:hypothetical protein
LILKNIHKKELVIISTIVISVVAVSFVLKHYVFNNKSRLKHIAKKDLKRWEGKKETDPSMSKELADYWRLVGMDVSKQEVQTSFFNAKYPWSAVYISHLVNNAGYKNFEPRQTHSGYTVDAKKNRSNKVKKSYWAYKPSELKKVEIGDILIKGRSGSKPNLDTINSGVLSHGDIVVDIQNIDGQKFAITQGGNVSDSVKQTRTPLTDNERLLNSVHFAQLKYEQ